MRSFLNKVGLFIKETNKTLLFMCMAMSAFGLLIVHSATLSTLTEDSVISRSVLSMAVAIAGGIIGCIIISAFEYDFIARLWPLIAFVCIALMLSLFVLGTAPDGRDDAKSWLKLGSFYFQPSELLKVGFTVTFSVHLDAVKDSINKLKNIFYLGLHAMFAVALVILTGDLGSALVFMVMVIGLMFVAGVKLRYFLIGFAAVCIAAPIIWFEFLADFQKQRFLAVYHPSSLTEATYETVIYQQKQGLSAIASGGLTGAGLFNGNYTQNRLVPESRNDMISIGKKANSTTGKYMCYSVAIMIAAQTVINIGMCLEVLPVIGITLPFMSAGGSSNLCIYFSIGLVLSVYRASVDRSPREVKRASITTPFAEV